MFKSKGCKFKLDVTVKNIKGDSVDYSLGFCRLNDLIDYVSNNLPMINLKGITFERGGAYTTMKNVEYMNMEMGKVFVGIEHLG